MDVLTLAGSVVFGALFEVRVLHDTELFEHGKRSIDGGDVHGRHATLNRSRDRLRCDVALDPHHFPKDGLSLRGETTPFSTKPRDDLLDAFHADATLLQSHCTCKRAVVDGGGEGQETLRSWTPHGCRCGGFELLSNVRRFVPAAGDSEMASGWPQADAGVGESFPTTFPFSTIETSSAPTS